MTPEFVQCDNCRSKVPVETCALATYRTTIDGKQYTFCCTKCAERYVKKKKKTKQ